MESEPITEFVKHGPHRTLRLRVAAFDARHYLRAFGLGKNVGHGVSGQVFGAKPCPRVGLLASFAHVAATGDEILMSLLARSEECRGNIRGDVLVSPDTLQVNAPSGSLRQPCDRVRHALRPVALDLKLVEGPF